MRNLQTVGPAGTRRGATARVIQAPGSTAALLRQVVAHLRQSRTHLCEEGARRTTESRLLTAMTRDEIVAEVTSVYDDYVELLKTGSVEALEVYARDLSERITPRGVETHEVLGIVLLLRDVLARSLFERYRGDFAFLDAVLDAYEPAANRIVNSVVVGLVQERERIVRRQQEVIGDFLADIDRVIGSISHGR